jgi:hypothetical protein
LARCALCAQPNTSGLMTSIHGQQMFHSAAEGNLGSRKVYRGQVVPHIPQRFCSRPQQKPFSNQSNQSNVTTQYQLSTSARNKRSTKWVPARAMVLTAAAAVRLASARLVEYVFILLSPDYGVDADLFPAEVRHRHNTTPASSHDMTRPNRLALADGDCPG